MYIVRHCMYIVQTYQTDKEEEHGEKKEGVSFHEEDGDNFRAAHV